MTKSAERMLALLLATICSVCPTASTDSHDPAPTASVQKADGKPLKALAAWMKLYRKGKIDYRDKNNISSKESIAVKYKVRTASDLGNPTWSGDLIVILKATAELGTAEAARAITAVASVGIEDKGKYTYSMAPYSVRVAALEALAMMTSKQAKEAVAAGARGEWSKGRDGNSLRAAALLGLGYLGDLSYVPVVEAALADGHTVTRIHAVESLQRLGDEKAISALISVVEKEGDDAVLVTAAKGLRTIYSKFIRDAEEKRDREAVRKSKAQEGDKPAADKKPIQPPPSARLAVRAAIKALGRTNWRADMVLVRLLSDFRSSESIPALITVLERFRDKVPFSFELLAVHLDQVQPGYDGEPLRLWLEQQGFAYEIIRQDTYSVVSEKIDEGRTYCSLCSRLRRGILYRVAKELRCKTIALGHHRDDANETLLLNLFYSGQLKAMPVRLNSDDGANVVIRPMMGIAEADLRRYAELMAFPILPCNLCGSQEGLKRVRTRLSPS